ncbi:MAG: GNAT family N-acetyltransferase, partial [Firmicutes bacterium]|nr:GNAT family N-acetyltransferase [Bacillota bacterium]
MTLRPYRPSDYAEVTRLFYDTIHSVNAADYPEIQLNAWAPKDVMLTKWRDPLPTNHYVVAEEDGVITGFGNADNSGYFGCLYVHKDYQRLGVATLIADDLENYIRLQGLQVATTDASITARPFFERRGYCVLKEQQVECRGQVLTNLGCKSPLLGRKSAMQFPFPLPLILDGATGTELQKRGLPSGVCPEVWILEHPETILELQRTYIDAGSQAVMAPTFGANRASLEKFGLSAQMRALNLRLVALSRETARDRALVGGDISPTGLFMEPLGDYTFDDIAGIYAEQAVALGEAGVDFFAIETQLSAAEAMAALKGIKSVTAEPVFVSFAVSGAGRTLWGDTLSAIAEDFETAGADAFGINCCGDLALITRVLREVHEKVALPLIAKPNAGLPRVAGSNIFYDMA